MPTTMIQTRDAGASGLHRKLLQVLHAGVIPRVQSEARLQVVVAGLPLVLPRGIAVTPHRGPALTESPQHTLHANQHWPEERLESFRTPCLIHVIEGEADLRVGITRDVAAEIAGRPEHPYSGNSYLTLGLPAGTFLFIPPGV